MLEKQFSANLISPYTEQLEGIRYWVNRFKLSCQPASLPACLPVCTWHISLAMAFGVWSGIGNQFNLLFASLHIVPFRLFMFAIDRDPLQCCSPENPPSTQHCVCVCVRASSSMRWVNRKCHFTYGFNVVRRYAERETEREREEEETRGVTENNSSDVP